MGISTNLYLPAIGTAGLLLVEVSGESLDPAPPPNITATTLFIIKIVCLNLIKTLIKSNVLRGTTAPTEIQPHHFFSNIIESLLLIV